MKKLLFIFALMLGVTFVSCGNVTGTNSTMTDSTMVDSIDSTVVDSVSK